jgi:hypothetical protein
MDTQVLLQTVLGEIKTPIFLAGFDRERSQLMLHVSEGHDLTHLKAAAQRACVKAEESSKIGVRSHRLSRLAHPRSLERWLRQFDTDEIIYDPTMVISRARGLLAASKACRLALGEAIGGLFFDPDRRTLFVLNTDKTAALLRRPGISRTRKGEMQPGCLGLAFRLLPNCRAVS